MRFLTWNIDQFGGDVQARQALLDQVGADIVLLQEVKVWLVRRLREQHIGPVLAGSDYHPDATASWITSVILLPHGATVMDSGMVERLPRPQRAVWADVRLEGLGRAHIVSWHNENAAQDQGRKMAAFRGMTAHLAAAPRPTILGADLNTWCDDPVLREADPEDLFADEHAFVGIDPVHGLLDAWRTLLTSRGDLSSDTDGPLATSYVLDSGRHRFDRILLSPDLTPVDGAYLYDEGRAAGSDHGAHWIDLELTEQVVM